MILTHMFRQIKQIRITLMVMFKVNPGLPNEVRHGTWGVTWVIVALMIVYSARGFSKLLPRIV